MDYEVINDIIAEDIIKMRELVGWKKPVTKEQFERGIKNTMCKVTIKNDKEVIAIGRIVGDYSCKGVLSDIIVSPKYQKMGYGKMVVQSLIKQVYDSLNEGEVFQIEATPTAGNRDFYVKSGMKYKPENQDGVYVWIEK